jgi:hypothetical protein
LKANPVSSQYGWNAITLVDENEPSKEFIVWNPVFTESFPHTSKFYQNDTIVVEGLAKNYKGTIEFTNTAASGETRNDPTIVRVEEVGTSTISVTDDAHAQVGAIAASGLNGQEVSFNVIVDSGYVATVKVNNKAVTPTDGVYSFVIEGDMSVVVSASEEGAVETWTDATMAKGTDAYDDATVNGKAAIKIGTSKKGGSMTITVASGATKLRLYACAWNGVSGLSLGITGATTDPSSIALTADSGLSNNSPFTLAGDEETYLFEINLSGITSETTLTFTTSVAKRCAVWGAQYK